MLERVKSKFAYVNKSEEVAIIKLSKTRLAFDPAVEDELENVTMEFDIAGLLSIRAKLRTYECMLDSSTSSSREFAIEDAENLPLKMPIIMTLPWKSKKDVLDWSVDWKTSFPE